MKVFLILAITLSICYAASLPEKEELASDHAKHLAKDCPQLELRNVAEIHKDGKKDEKKSEEKSDESDNKETREIPAASNATSTPEKLIREAEKAKAESLNATEKAAPKSEKLEAPAAKLPTQKENLPKKSRRSAGSYAAIRAFADDGFDGQEFPLKSNFNFAVRTAPAFHAESLAFARDFDEAPAFKASSGYGGFAAREFDFDDAPAFKSSGGYGGFRAGKSLGGYGGAAVRSFESAPIQREIVEVVREVPVIQEVEVVREVQVPVIQEVIREVEVPVFQEVVREVPVRSSGYGGSPVRSAGYGGAPARAFSGSRSGYGRSLNGFASRSAGFLSADFSDLPESREFPVVRSAYDDAPIRVAFEDDFRAGSSGY